MSGHCTSLIYHVNLRSAYPCRNPESQAATKSLSHRAQWLWKATAKPTEPTADTGRWEHALKSGLGSVTWLPHWSRGHKMPRSWGDLNFLPPRGPRGNVISDTWYIGKMPLEELFWSLHLGSLSESPTPDHCLGGVGDRGSEREAPGAAVESHLPMGWGARNPGPWPQEAESKLSLEDVCPTFLSFAEACGETLPQAGCRAQPGQLAVAAEAFPKILFQSTLHLRSISHRPQTWQSHVDPISISKAHHSKGSQSQ